MKVTVLGCGNSSGVPFIGCDCKVCTSKNPKNNRMRVSLFIEVNGVNLLIDSSPDLRQQALRHNIRRVDAVLYTHDHADHTGGVDELRSFNHLENKELPIYGTQETLDTLKQRYSYVFMPRPEKIWYRPALIPHTLKDEDKVEVKGVPVTIFEQLHGKVKTSGYRIGNFAYSTDTNALPDSAFEALKGVEIWVVDCLRYTTSPSHSHLEQTLGWIDRVKPRLAVLTHMAHDFDYDGLLSELPSGVVPGYDGMVLEGRV